MSNEVTIAGLLTIMRNQGLKRSVKQILCIALSVIVTGCIASGISIGTLFTLFVVPAMYMLLAEEHRQEEGEGNQEAIISV